MLYSSKNRILLRKNTNDFDTFKTVFNTLSHQWNYNQNYFKISSDTSQMAKIWTNDSSGWLGCRVRLFDFKCPPYTDVFKFLGLRILPEKD